MKTTLAVLSLCLCSLPSVASAAVRITDVRGAASASATVVKGRSIEFAAAADADAGARAIAWSALPEGVLAVADLGGGRVRVTGLRDWFDETPRREPTARLIACDGTSCASVLVTCLPDVAGRWPTLLEVGGLLGGSETRNLVFVQDGRSITFDPEPANPADPARIATLRLEGATLRLVRRGTVLTRFDGALSDLGHGSGNWASSWGFSGTWRATRSP